VPDPKSQVEQITIALIYKFMDDMDAEAEELGGSRNFFAGEYARYGWGKLMRSGLGGHETLNLYAEAIAKMPENPASRRSSATFSRTPILPYRDPETLRAFLKIIDEFAYDHSERLGDAFEYSALGARPQGDAGQFRTPRHIIDFIVAVVDPKKTDTVLDPACGTAGFLISSFKHILRPTPTRTATARSPRRARAAGRRISRATTSRPTWCACRWSICTCTASPTRTSSSTTRSPPGPLERIRRRHSRQPALHVPEGRHQAAQPLLGAEQAQRGAVRGLHGRAPHTQRPRRHHRAEGIIFQSQTAYTQLRKMLVEEYLVAVLSLPAVCSTRTSGVKTSILILDKCAGETGPAA
jgi:type I restriction enzyme M protein